MGRSVRFHATFHLTRPLPRLRRLPRLLVLMGRSVRFHVIFLLTRPLPRLLVLMGLSVRFHVMSLAALRPRLSFVILTRTHHHQLLLNVFCGQAVLQGQVIARCLLGTVFRPGAQSLPATKPPQLLQQPAAVPQLLVVPVTTTAQVLRQSARAPSSKT